MSFSRAEHTHRRYVSFCLAQNWSMHEKYASRHVLYPVPNVFDAVVVAARAGVRAARAIDDTAATVFVAVRALFAVVAVRAAVD